MILKPYPLGEMLRWIFYEYKYRNSIFSIKSNKFYKGSKNFKVVLHGRISSNPLGPAAGPHTQMTQNIVMGYICGLRIFELKTVQIMDELQISRPCIDARNVVFNVEWSQELKIHESLREYVKAYIILEILKNEKIVEGDFIFDVSIGYDYKGITETKMVDFVQSLKDATKIIDELRMEIPEEFKKYRDFPFNPYIANGITLSTFHGCPKDEIEKIAEFILKEHKMNVIIKLNPTQLPRQELEWILYDKLHYRHLKINPKAYEVALSFEEAVSMMKKLYALANSLGLNAGYKLTNTLEVLNEDNFFKPTENVMYLSAQPLYVIAIYLAGKMRKELPHMTASF
ncbi:MAG: glutamate synthase, partial [bacterium]|nr:glutamate synthase [bacterium]